MMERCGWTVPFIVALCFIQATFLYLDRSSRGEVMCGDSEIKIATTPGYLSTSPLANLRSYATQKEEEPRVETTAVEVKATDGTGDRGSKNHVETRQFYYRPLKNTNEATNMFEGIKARAFEPWSERQFIPCHEPESDWWKYETQQMHTYDGVNYLKLYKTGSSTSSGITLRIARNAARRQKQSYPLCKVRFDHAWASKLFYDLDFAESVLWTMVREPTSRIVSQFFHFEVSRDKHEPTDEYFLEYLRSEKNSGILSEYYTSAVTLKPYAIGRTNPVVTANRIFDEYNFIGITERMDESVVALAMILHIPLGDVLYLKAKGHGGFDDGGGRPDHLRICTYIWPAFVSNGMYEFFETDEYQDLVHWDYVFYKAANRSLDLTIERLGRDKFQANLDKFLQAKRIASERCLPRTVFPCSEGGEYKPLSETDCMWNDSGCGMECLDEVAADLGL
jgi:hypothetical protein